MTTTVVSWASSDAVCVNCRPTCPDPTYHQHFIEDKNRCQACGCRDFEAENPE